MNPTQEAVNILRDTCSKVLSSETQVSDQEWVAYQKVSYALYSSHGCYKTLEDKLYNLYSFAARHQTANTQALRVYLSAYQIFEGV